MLQPSHRNGRPFVNGNLNSMESPTRLDMESPSGILDDDSEASASSIETEVPENVGWVGGGRPANIGRNISAQKLPTGARRTESAAGGSSSGLQGPSSGTASVNSGRPSTTAARNGMDTQRGGVNSDELEPVLDEPVLDIPETQGAADWTMESWDGEQDGGNIDGLLEVASDSSSVVSDEVLLQTNLGDDFLSLFAAHPNDSTRGGMW
jgi:hypothetical protein